MASPKGEGWGEGLHLARNGCEDALWIARKLAIRNSKNTNPARLEPGVAYLVAFERLSGAVRRSVQFDHQSRSATEEVYNVRSDRMLSSPLGFYPTKRLPQDTFRDRGRSAEPAGNRAWHRPIVGRRWSWVARGWPSPQPSPVGRGGPESRVSWEAGYRKFSPSGGSLITNDGAFQMSFAYSRIVRSDENMPIFAMLRTAISCQRSGDA